MDRAAALARLNRQVLEIYSRRTTTALRAALPLPLALPWLDRLLALNVEKEARKDALVIAKAADAVVAGIDPDYKMAETLLIESKKIDRDFLARAGGAPLDILIRYEVIDPVRITRIRLLLETACRTLEGWQRQHSLSAALAEALPGAMLEKRLLELFILYARETRVLGEAVRMPLLLTPLRQRVVAGLYGTMEKTATGLAREVVGRVVRDKGRH